MVMDRREAEQLTREYVEEALEYGLEAIRVCANCGLCLQACTTYQATRDPRLSPPYRLRAAVKALRGERLSGDEVVALYTCNLCGGCTMACPFAIEVLRVVHAARIRLRERGVIPASLSRVSEAAARSGHSFVADAGEVVKRLVDSARDAGASIDEPCDALYAPTPFDTTLYPNVLPEVLRLLRRVGLHPGVSRRVLDAGGNVGIDANDLATGLVMLGRAVEAAEELGARLLVVGPCGADWKLVLLARELGVVRHERVKCVYDVLAERGVRVDCRDCLLYTSCTFARLDPERSVVRIAAARLPRDKPPYTRCCGGAGGLNYLHEEPYASIRRRVYEWRFRVLESQARGRPAAIPCVKCYTVYRHGALLAKKPLYPLRLLTSILEERTRGGSASQP